ncbi:Two-component system response regulator, putative sensor [Alteracholeplasma palmae J233]|uniref:Two-component system response regulator, putative sensor n=1 Tax=Alteracholeplasma palmae (strain ATCC 49389 / J233) TaxID=1318466 RepID=U4KL05_ALTPJ|nr:GHKL domain-containing protein [Alteracholeplasma palmae]CCV64398.1 Two-component system response regulator, putative sensor [Alteracholeplasma palmae J233]
MTDFIVILSYISSTLFLYLYIRNYSQYFPFRKCAWIAITFIFLATLLPLLNFSWLDEYMHIRLFFAVVAYFIAFPGIFRTNIVNYLFLTFNFILKTYCFFLFFSAIFATAESVSLSLSWINDSYYYHLTHVCTYLASSMSIMFLDHLLLNTKLKDLLTSKRLMGFLLSIQIIMLLNLVAITNGQVYSFDDSWYNVLVMVISISVFAIYFIIRLFTANLSYLIGYKSRTKTLEKQLNIQLDHYHVYESQVRDFLKFKHDYTKTLNAMNLLLDQKNYTAVVNVLSSSITNLSSLKLSYKEYSNNVIIDALLNNYARKFKLIESEFSSTAFLSMDLPFNDLDLIKLFSNIMDNCYEAVSKVKQCENRFVTIDSTVKNGFQLLTITNSSNKTPMKQESYTSKRNKMLHGFGLSIISEILENIGGFILYKKTTINTIPCFQLVLHIPLDEHKKPL